MMTKHAQATNFKGFTVCAAHYSKDGVISFIEAATELPTLADAEAFAARFPKSIRVHANTISGATDKGVRGWVSFHANFVSNGVTGGKNETSIKRTKAFFAACEKLGLELRFDDVHCSNQIHDRATIEAQF